MLNCFGVVVDNSKLGEMARYVGNPMTREDRAREAMNLENEDNKKIRASRYVQSVKASYGPGLGVSTLCLVYNATGDTLYYVADHNWFGITDRSPYPDKIGNGQWAAFHHHNTCARSGSVAAVVYRGKNKDGQDRDYLLAWSTPWGHWYNNKAYCQIGDANYFQEDGWGNISVNLDNAGYSFNAKSDECEIEARTGQGGCPVFHAIIKIPFSP